MIKFTKEEFDIVKKYYDLANLNPENKTSWDLVMYIFVKIMFEHPLVDGNKRLACKWLLKNCEVDEEIINEVCKSLAKEIR